MRVDVLNLLKDKINDLKSVSYSRKSERFPVGASDLDHCLNGGLKRGALHEFQAETWGDEPSALGMVLGLAHRSASGLPIMLLHQQFLDAESGHIHGAGLVEFGLDPGQFVMFRARNADEVLRAGCDAAHCSALGAAVLALHQKHYKDWLSTSRKLALACEASGVTVFLLHLTAMPQASAAATRWHIRAAPSRPLPANAPGHMRCAVSLVRHRGGVAGGCWVLEWNRDQRRFDEAKAISEPLRGTALSGIVVPVPFNRPDQAQPQAEWRKQAS
jgi:protein ImuA